MKKITFKKPETLVVPDGVSTNGEFEALATLKIGDDGQLTLVAIDGNQMAEEGEEQEDESVESEAPSAADEMTYAQAASEGMP